MANNHSEIEKRLWATADELRANSKLKSNAAGRARSPDWRCPLRLGLSGLILIVSLAGCYRPVPSSGDRRQELPPVLRKDKLVSDDVPELLAILDETDSGGTTEQTRYRKANALQKATTLGPSAKAVLPAILRMVTASGGNTLDSDLRHRASSTLYKLSQQKVEGLFPLLLEEVRGVSPRDAHSILLALGEFGPEASQAVPALVAMLGDSKYSSIHNGVLVCLKCIGPDAREAIPAILPLLESKKRLSAQAALRRIAPEKKW